MESIKDQEGREEFMMSDSWGLAADMEENEMFGDATDSYRFKKDNPFLSHENPFALGLSLISKCLCFDAILALEAAL